MSNRPRRRYALADAALVGALADQFEQLADAYYRPIIGAGTTEAVLRSMPVDKLDPAAWVRRAARLRRGQSVYVQGHEIPHRWRPPRATVDDAFRVDADGSITPLGSVSEHGMRRADERPDRITGEIGR